jgi:ribosomal protein L7/L12
MAFQALLKNKLHLKTKLKKLKKELEEAGATVELKVNIFS